MDAILRKNFVFLRRNLRLKKELLAYMFQEHLIDDEEYDQLENEAKSEPERVRYFIMTAMRGKTKSDLRRLVQMLRKTNQEPVAHRLERANVRKKKWSKRLRKRAMPYLSSLVVFVFVHKLLWRTYQANKPHVEKVLKIIFGKRPEIKEGIMPENSNSDTSDPSKNHTLEIKERVKLRFYFPNLPKDTYKIVEEGLRSSLSLSLDLPRDLLEVFAKPFSSVLVIVILPGAAALKLFSILSKPLPNFLYEKYGPTRLKIESLRPMNILFEKAFERNWGSRAWIQGQVARLNECRKNFHQLKTQLSYWLPPPWWQKATKNRFRKFQSQLDHVQDEMQALKDSFSKLSLLPKPQAVEVSTQTELQEDGQRQ
ncbi:uncharacterized protein [Oscarella lobularis]|uniref:uncharacterized protein isoform X2 n=1 Tax=Oscarella lobularis TaxID=121494 RepID=UPI003313DABC